MRGFAAASTAARAKAAENCFSADSLQLDSITVLGSDFLKEHNSNAEKLTNMIKSLGARLPQFYHKTIKFDDETLVAMAQQLQVPDIGIASESWKAASKCVYELIAAEMKKRISEKLEGLKAEVGPLTELAQEACQRRFYDLCATLGLKEEVDRRLARRSPESG